MIQLILFNIITIAILDKCLLKIKLDTDSCKFNFDISLGLFYSILPWYNNAKHGDSRVIDIICPILFDLRLFIFK